VTAEGLDSTVEPFSELAPLAPRSGPPLHHGGPWPARLWEQLLGALPVLLMALLAALSWWLVKNTPAGNDGSAAKPLRPDPDYTMSGFAVSHYGADGVLRSRLEGDLLHHYPATDTVEVEGVRLRAADAAGRMLHGSAQRAYSNGEATRVRLVGDARVVREPAAGEAASARLEILGEALEFDTAARRVRSEQPVTLLTGQGELRAGNLDYSETERVGRLGGRVTGQLNPGTRP
jgi:lipopolysaccharide export system protein LptC